MPQINTRPQPAKKIISASIPQNISAEDRQALIKSWDEKAAKRSEQIALETRIPSEPTKKFKYELWKYGRHWMAVYAIGPKKYKLMPTPSLFSSAINAINDKMEEAFSQ